MAEDNTKLIGVGLVTLLVGLVIGGFGGWNMAPEAVQVPGPETTLTVTNTVYADYLTVDGLNYTAEDIGNFIANDDINKEFNERFSVSEAAFGLFKSEWKDEFKWFDGVDTFDYDDLNEEGIDVALEDSPKVENSWDFLNDVNLVNVDHEDNEWTAEFQVEFEVDGVDYIYNVKAEVDPTGEVDKEGNALFEASHLELEQA